MMRLRGLAAGAAQRCLLRVASLLVPAAARQEWICEWEAELWHVRRTCAPEHAFSWQSEREVTAFCFGAFPDALCVRGDARESGEIHAPVQARGGNSPAQCLLTLAAILLVCLVCAALLPGVRAQIEMVRYRIRAGLISFNGPIPIEQFHDWKTSSQRYFDGLAFYHTAAEPVSTSSGRTGSWHKWQVAYASSNLFELLGLPVSSSASAASDEPVAFLSQEVWYRDYGANPQIVGELVEIGSRTVRIAGIVPYGVWRLPSSPDLWLLEPEAELAAEMPHQTLGYVLGHLTKAGQDLAGEGRVFVTTYDAKDDSVVLNATALEDHTPAPWDICGFALLLVVLALPAVTSVSMSESQFSSYRPTRKSLVSRWLFLAGKITLVVAIACVAALDVGCGLAAFNSSTEELIQFALCFALGLLGMRWALVDQGQRCPVCLRCVAHPAQVGLASRTFLGWSGTEMMCPGGHTLLHMPSLPTSWFGAQRWLYLDSSWDFLFADF
jgi:hypothetical protein